MAALTRLRLQPVLQGDVVEVTVPSYRLDLNIEVDLVEEVARVIGYDQGPVRDEISIRVARSTRRPSRPRRCETRWWPAGTSRAVTVGFVSDLLATDFVPPGADARNPLPRAGAVTRKENARLRPSILPGLLESVRLNETKGVRDARLFEIGSTFYNAAPAAAAGGAAATCRGRSWSSSRSSGWSGRRTCGRSAGWSRRCWPSWTRPARSGWCRRTGRGSAAGRPGRIEWGGVAVGHLGRVSKDVPTSSRSATAPCAAELDVASLLAGAQLVPQLKPLPQFPAAERDLSLVVPDAVRYEAVEALVAKVGPANLESLSFVTTYRGKPLEKGQKSVTLRFVFRSPAGTLTSDQVEQAVGQVVDRAKAELGATLRG
jgi:phenylalanyl-tRNA synthetase beta chain